MITLRIPTKDQYAFIEIQLPKMRGDNGEETTAKTIKEYYDELDY